MSRVRTAPRRLHPTRNLHRRRLAVVPALALVAAGVVGPLAAQPAGAAAGDTVLLSARPDGTPGNGSTYEPSISDDGSIAAFATRAQNLEPAAGGEDDGALQMIVRESSTGAIHTVSVSSTGEVGNGSSYGMVSGNGRYVVFASSATNLVPDDTNGVDDIFIHDLSSGTTERLSRRVDGSQPVGTSVSPTISADGRFVAFMSPDDQLVPDDTNNRYDLFVFDRQTETTTRANLTSTGEQSRQSIGDLPRISANGRYVVFVTSEALVPDDDLDSIDIYRRDLVAGQTVAVSVGPDGHPVGEDDHGIPNRHVNISADGRYVTFSYLAAGIVADDTNAQNDVFVRDMGSGVTELVSVTDDEQPSLSYSGGSTVSANGRYVAFYSQGDLAGDGHETSRVDAYVRDRLLDTTTRINGQGPATGDRYAYAAKITPDGRYVTFFSVLPRAGGSRSQAFVYDQGPQDTTPPVVTLDSVPPLTSSDDSPTFAFSSEAGATFECSLTSGRVSSPVPCTSPITYPDRPAATYTFAVKAIDAAGNVSAPASYVFTITAAPPVDPPTACDTATNPINGTDAANTIPGTRNADRINGLAGNDTITGKAGADCIYGGLGNDAIKGSAGDDELLGDDGNDKLSPGPGMDVADGGIGNDKILARDGAVDRIDCGPGTDTATVDPDDVVVNCETVRL